MEYIEMLVAHFIFNLKRKTFIEMLVVLKRGIKGNTYWGFIDHF